eukprot:TRINITY_DN433_c0_g1_i1.p1 TRINITY_DN433_c0_g1~~TRINITY_DN433_c0_g1_i1.p1  ORF type:complete len:419 (-),score=43.86 TRINITY_DN433_c0_g1_i1:116-1372(-)
MTRSAKFLTLVACAALCSQHAAATALRAKTGSNEQLQNDMATQLHETVASAGGLRMGFGTTSNVLAKRPPAQAVYGTLYVGTPAQEFRILYDTSSGNIILPSKKCDATPCLQHKTYDLFSSVTSHELEDKVPRTIGMGTGSLTALPISDKVCLGPEEMLCAHTSFLEATAMSDEPFDLLPYDGILGLGMTMVSEGKSYNFLGNLAEAESLEQNRFAVWFAMQGDTDDSEITFGTVPMERIGSDIHWLSLSDRKSGLWQVAMSDTTLNLVRLGLCGNTGCQAVFDTGSGVIGGPSGFINGLITATNVMQDCGNYQTLPTLGFELGGTTLNIDKADYVRRTEDGCFHQFLPVDFPSEDGPLVLLGTPFLQRYIAVFDREFLRVGLAFAKHKSYASGETNEEAVARLMARDALGNSKNEGE